MNNLPTWAQPVDQREEALHYDADLGRFGADDAGEVIPLGWDADELEEKNAADWDESDVPTEDTVDGPF